MPGAALPPGAPGAGSTIPSLPLRRLLLAESELELPPPGSEAASCTPFSHPTSPEGRLRGSSSPSRRHCTPPSTLEAEALRNRGGKTCVAAPCPAWLPPAPGEEGLRIPHRQTRPRSLKGRRGCPSRFPTASTSRRLSFRRWSQPLSGVPRQ
ncbi:Leucine-Rich Repeat And Fibronectin Type Iii Domain-Containing Protein 1 [Manis pentadactyla]|nr:Leucine-Rich Repeat And Fibronectin Type Iii Domain-Containing Protein 1 [Manis pentadactyla]